MGGHAPAIPWYQLLASGVVWGGIAIPSENHSYYLLYEVTVREKQRVYNIMF
jgi:hypothetical protein